MKFVYTAEYSPDHGVVDIIGVYGDLDKAKRDCRRFVKKASGQWDDRRHAWIRQYKLNYPYELTKKYPEKIWDIMNNYEAGINEGKDIPIEW